MSSPAFQLYADDFLSGTIDMSQEEVGAYIRLLCHQWGKGSVPDDKARLQRIAGGRVSDAVMAKFPKGQDGLLRNPRLEAVRAERDQYSAKQAGRAKTGWETRRRHMPDGSHATAETVPDECRGNAAASPAHMPRQCSPSPSPYIDPPPRAREDGVGTQFPPDVEVPVELPAGFPRTVQDAVQASATVGCPADFVEIEWQKAHGRGGRDAKDVPIRNWASYLATQFAYSRRRGGDSNREKTGAPTSGTSSRPLFARVKDLEAEVERHPGNPNNNVGTTQQKKDRRPEWLAKQRELDALRRQLNQPATEPVA